VGLWCVFVGGGRCGCDCDFDSNQQNPWCDQIKMNTSCPHFSSFDYQAIEQLKVLPPLEPRDKTIGWARGSIRDQNFNELFVTGPRLPVLFSGCRYNSVVFSIRGPGADDPSHALECFLHKVLSHVEATVSANVEKFKPGLKNTALLHFDRDFIRPSSYGAEFPNEFRVKLAVKRDYDDNGEMSETIETLFVDEHENKIDPDNITNESEIIPIFKVSYYRNANKFGLNIIMHKGMVFQANKKRKTIDNADLQFDIIN
jgi:hypothetical protein